jgi:hypothetical protein
MGFATELTKKMSFFLNELTALPWHCPGKCGAELELTHPFGHSQRLEFNPKYAKSV